MEAAEVTTVMKPWEQHHAVISMPRFAYNPASVMKQSAGFLVTCTFRREKSATKEILALIHEYMNFTVEDAGRNNPICNGAEEKKEQIDKQPAEVEQGPPGSVLNSQAIVPLSWQNEESEMRSENLKILETGRGNTAERSISKEAGSGACVGKEDSRSHDEGQDRAFIHLGQGNNSQEEEEDLTLSTGGKNEFTLVKLATMGVIYICAAGKPPSTVLDVASRIMKDVQAGTKATPQWCHRLVPVQATCSMKTEELQAVVSQLVKDHLRDRHIPSGEQLLNYAVAFNRRGADVAKNSSKETIVLGRDECIRTVTAAVEQVTSSVRVDLTVPEMVIIVELIPVAGAQSCLMCAVSVLPGDLTVSKPKLNIKPLAPVHPRSKKRKHPKQSISKAW